jgi:hypothetical protein
VIYTDYLKEESQGIYGKCEEPCNAETMKFSQGDISENAHLIDREEDERLT